MDENGTIRDKLSIKQYDYRHQMPDGALCLFQRETRAEPAGDIVSGVDALRRATRWFLGVHTGHWPPDSAESELEAHFRHVTDILLSETLYSGALECGHGHFYFARDYRRAIDAPTDDCPMIVTSLTIERDGIVQVVDTRDELQRVYPWIRGEAWGTTTVIGSETRGATGFDPVEHGYWWSLPEEPRPFTNGEGLLRELRRALAGQEPWEAVQAAFGTRMTTETGHHIALRYPGRHGAPEWLVVIVVTGTRRDSGGFIYETDLDKKARFEAAPVGGVRVHSISPSTLNLRNTGVVAPEIAGKTVALIGLGALGSEVAELLAKAGVSGFRLCDSDRLATGNVTRHVGGVTEFGAAKSRVVISRLLQINPHLKFVEEDVEAWSATGEPDKLFSIIQSTDLVISTTADENVESVVNHFSILADTPAVYGRALRAASLGRAFLVRPEQDACKTCLAAYSEAGHTGLVTPEDWINVQESEDDVLLHECGRPIIAGSGIDLSFVASLTARIALTILEGRDTETNHWLWTGTAAVDVDPRLSNSLSTFSGRLEPRRDCPTCSEPEIVRLIMSDEARVKIVSETESSPTAETCGVLIGYVDEQRQAMALRAPGPGPTAVRSTSICHRDIEHVQVELDLAAEELGDQGSYLGEWHSHLVPEPEPSPTDIESLVGIARAPNYLTRCPVMIIAGLDPDTGQCASLLAWAFPVGRAMYPVPIEHK